MLDLDVVLEARVLLLEAAVLVGERALRCPARGRGALPRQARAHLLDVARVLRAQALHLGSVHLYYYTNGARVVVRLAYSIIYNLV